MTRIGIYRNDADGRSSEGNVLTSDRVIKTREFLSLYIPTTCNIIIHERIKLDFP